MTSDTAPSDLTAFQRDCLVVIQRLGDPHGLAIKQLLEDAYGGKEIRHGRLYPNLDRLVDKGIIHKGRKDKRTNEYSLSQRGERVRAELAAWYALEARDG